MMDIQVVSLYWENTSTQRYYQAYLEQDLLTDWLLVKIWGRRGTRLGRRQQVVCQSYEHGITLMKKLVMLRDNHGYKLKHGVVCQCLLTFISEKTLNIFSDNELSLSICHHRHESQ